MLRAGILFVAVAAAVAGCGFAPIPGMGPTMRHPSSTEVPETPELPPMLTAPTISDEAMERAVEAGLARSDDETWRRIEGCLTPAPLAVGGNPFAGLRMAGLDPRLSRARVLKQQGLLDAAYVLLVDVLCEYRDSYSKSTVLLEMVSNREETGDFESAVWFVEAWTRADASSVTGQQEFARQQAERLQSTQRGMLGSLMSSQQSAQINQMMQQSGRDMRLQLLLPAATSYARLGDRERARQKLAEAQALMAAAPAAPRERDEAAHRYYQLAEASARVGDVPGALRAYAEGERRRDHTRADLTVPMLSLVLAELGQHADAQRVAEATLTESAAWSIEPRAGDRADPSDRHAAEVERVSYQLAGAGAVEIAHTALAEVSIARGDGETALRHLAQYDQAHARRLAAQQATSAAMQRYAGTAGGFAGVLDTVTAQLRATAYKERAQRAWRYGQAEKLAGHPREAATQLLQAVATVESLRGLIRPEDRVAFFGRQTSPYAALVDTLIGLARTDDLTALPAEQRGQTPAEVAFHYAEAARARLLSEQIARTFVGAAERDLPAEVRERERALQGRATAELRRGVPYDQSAAYAEFQRFVESLRTSYPDYATLKYPVPVSARQVPLRDGEALVAYALLDTRIVIWLLRRGEPPSLFTSPVGRDDVLATAEAFRRSVSVTGGRLPAFDADAADKLYRWLLAEPLALIPAGATVMVVPDGVLSTLPFEALGPTRAGSEPAFAGARYTFAYMPSATVLTFERTAKRVRGAATTRPLLAVGDPVYESVERAPAVAQPTRQALATRAAREAIRQRGLPLFDPLPATRVEVTRIATTLGVPPDSPDIRLGRAANERDIKALDLGAYRYVHFATHGILAGDVPYINQPALVLSQTADLGGEDGFLTMSEVLTLPLRADMVVLSACQTALGREVTGEGVVGLTRAFLYAGSRAAVVSLWPVDDASTALFMGRFYEHVKSGQPPARALARARQDLRAEARYAHPFYWAPFVFFGGE
jgi:CHAT domain-containing protein